jgi:hypothetical protein
MIERRLTISEDRLPRRIFEPEREEVTGGWMNLHNAAIHNLYSPPNIVSAIKSTGKIWAGHEIAHEWER